VKGIPSRKGMELLVTKFHSKDRDKETPGHIFDDIMRMDRDRAIKDAADQ